MPFHQKWHFLLALLVTVLLQQYATFCTIGLTYDSPFYVGAAQSFAEKWVFLDQYGQPYTNWTPLFPVLLSLFPTEVILWAKFLHLLACLETVFIFLILAEVLIESYLLRILFSLVIVFSTPLLLISSFLWSESVFVCLLGVVVYLSYRSFCSSEAWSNRTFFLLILFSNLLYLQRNAGLFFIIAIGLFLFFKEIFKKHFPKRSFIYTSLSLVSFVVWQIRNHFFVPKLSDFKNNVFVVSFWESLIYMADIISLWLLPNVLPLWVRLLFLIAFLFALAYALWKAKALAAEKWDMLSILLLMCGVYIAFMLALRMNVEEENERYLAPLYPLFFLAIFIVFELLLRVARDNVYSVENQLLKSYFVKEIFTHFYNVFLQAKRNKISIFLILITLWLPYPVWRTLKNAQLWHQNQCKLARMSKT